MGVSRRSFQANKLQVVDGAESFNDGREPPLCIGDRVCLNSGSNVALVVEIGPTVIISWPNGAEAILPRQCVHRSRD
jgi:hypothetical protein